MVSVRIVADHRFVENIVVIGHFNTEHLCPKPPVVCLLLLVITQKTKADGIINVQSQHFVLYL